MVHEFWVSPSRVVDLSHSLIEAVVVSKTTQGSFFSGRFLRRATRQSSLDPKYA